jgi:hypothetical protein
MVRLLPEEEWRDQRGKSHPFRMSRSSPVPNEDGSWSGKRAKWISADILGCIALHPGATRGKQCVIADYCTKIVKVNDDVTGAYYKETIWELPEFKKEAQIQKDAEQRSKAKETAYLLEYEQTALRQREDAIQRFLIAMASVARISWRTPKNVLQDIMLINKIEDTNQREIDLGDWLAVVAPIEPLRARPETYDPATFLPHAAQMFASNVRHHEIDQKKTGLDATEYLKALRAAESAA